MELNERLGVEGVADVLMHGQLMWFVPGPSMPSSICHGGGPRPRLYKFC